jgi:2-keto-3-deoxy-L-rhamnonate aldolase RhmA
VDGRGLKGLWAAGRPTFGAWITLADPAVGAVMANVGFDFLVLDAEHSPFDPETLRTMLLVLKDRQAVPIVRIRSNDESIVKQVLDWGAEGIMFPLILSAADARRAAGACRYPPRGVRGVNPREASNFFKDFDHYMATANDRIVAILQVEREEAVHNLEEILQVRDLDALMIGPADLSFSLGIPMQFKHPKLQAAIEETVRKAKSAGIPVGVQWDDDIEHLKEYVGRGVTFFISPLADYDFISSGSTQWLRTMRQAAQG